MPGINLRLRSFVLERYPFALPIVERALEACPEPEASAEAIDSYRPSFRDAVMRHTDSLHTRDLPEPTPGVEPRDRIGQAVQALVDACDGFLARESIAASALHC